MTEIELRLETSLKQELSLRQRIESAHLMMVPDMVLSLIASAISFKPEEIETVLREKRRGDITSDAVAKIHTIYGSLTPSKGDVEYARGVIIAPDIKPLENIITPSVVNITPDVTYIARKTEKPEIVFSDHLRGFTGLALLQINDGQYPETARLMHQLQHFDEWKRGKLKEAYVILGGAQREYFEEFDPVKYTVFNQDDLATELKISESSVSRILANRWVEARRIDGEQKVLNAKDLLVTRYEFQRHQLVPLLNKVLEEESKKGKAFSDREIAAKVPRIKTRTIAKYRLECGIPGSSERNEQYILGMTAPYRFD